LTYCRLTRAYVLPKETITKSARERVPTAAISIPHSRFRHGDYLSERQRLNHTPKSFAQRAAAGAFRAMRGFGWTALPGGKAVVNFMIQRFKKPYGYVHGFPMELDRADNLKLSIFGVYEPVETEIVRSEVGEGDTALDIGANVGYYTLLLARLTGESGNVFAFEPHVGNFTILERNVTRNRLANVTMVNAAVGETTGSATLYLSRTNPGDHHLFDVTGDLSFETEKTTVVALDDYLDADVKVDFVKMDIQGAEPAALAGMERVLTRQRRVNMLCEFWPSGMQRAGFDAGEFLDRVTDLGFVYRHVDQKERRLVNRSKSELLSTQWIVEKSTNLFLSRH
jgi:FkbM family methyltransferase